MLTERVIVLCVYAAHACSFNYKSVYSKATLRNIVEPLNILSRTSTLIMQNDVCRVCKHDFFCNFFNDLSFEIEITNLIGLNEAKHSAVQYNF